MDEMEFTEAESNMHGNTILLTIHCNTMLYKVVWNLYEKIIILKQTIKSDMIAEYQQYQDATVDIEGDEEEGYDNAYDEEIAN